jgi:hypothetical protein
LAEARLELQELKRVRRLGRCPASEFKLEKKQQLQKAEQGKKRRVSCI